jgi:DNA adenine methylase
MNSLIKWPGGKSREYNHIKDLIPQDTNTYIEPFFGGGGVFFKLQPNKAIVNDINKNLMSLYKFIKEENVGFRKILIQIANDWDHLSIISEHVYNSTKKYKYNINEKSLEKEIKRVRSSKKLPRLINGQKKYWELLTSGLINKLQRIVSLEIKNGAFDENDFSSQIAAATKGAYYYYLRDQFVPRTKEEKVAQFFFLREYCFGSMFRFNSEGKFNIPYGGASYNNKRFHSKISNAFSDNARSLLNNTEIYCEDFKTFFQKIYNDISEKDFCFFDPPYDTRFSEYDRNSFDKEDQRDLAELFRKLKCKSLMIIKKTPFIYDLYKEQKRKNPAIQIKQYRKNYSYNIRGRNGRRVIHLLISNYNTSDKRPPKDNL